MKNFLVLIITFILFSNLNYSQWTNQNPVPDGNDLWSTFFINDSTGWIVGLNGFIKKTNNMGLDWNQQTSGTNLSLRSVQFIDENTGWICGEEGLILKTINGGQDWFQLTSGTSELLTCLNFCNLDTGYAVGYSETIIKTTDGGLSWITQSSGSLYALFSVDFISPLLGYAVGGEDSVKFLKTSDGGNNWIDQSIDLGIYNENKIYEVTFLDEYIGFLGGGRHDYGNFIFKTTDGGTTWNESTMNNMQERRQGDLIVMQFDSLESGDINSIYFKDSNIGYAVGGYYSGWDREIYTTNDGGDTWMQKYRGSEEDGLISVYGNSTGQAWAVGFSGAIFTTEDNGDNWVQILSGNKSAHWNNGDDICSVFFVNENIGWASGKRDYNLPGAGEVILKTTNGGKVWKTQLFAESSSESIRCVYFINEFIGWALGTNGMWKTTNGGEFWDMIGDIEGNSSTFFIDQNNGWSTADDYPAGIYKSTDGGNIWVQKSSVSSSSIYFSNINIGWAVGDAGSILKSTDGGETWIAKTSGTSSKLNSVKFYNPNVGMCVGNNGTALLSTNGGESWVSFNLNTTDTLCAIAFTNLTNIWIAGYNGTVLNTTDLGSSWNSFDSFSDNNFTSMSFVNENNGWIGGLNGSMYKYSTEPVTPAYWSNQIIVQDSGGIEAFDVITFGQHPDATDSIDLSLGEYELPPPPIPTIFDLRFNLPTNPPVSSLLDFRDSALTEISWSLSFQPGLDGYPIIFSWDSTGFPEGSFYLKDQINGSFVNIDMKNQSNYVLTQQGITSLMIEYRGICSSVSVNNNWNIISVPLLAENMSLNSLFPTATSLAYSYDIGYISEDTLDVGSGYWLNFGTAEEIQICGLLPEDSIQVREGWNMIGVYENDIPIDQITTTPQGIVATYFFGFDDGYYIADTLKTGQGYWVRVTEDGMLNFNSETLNDKEQNYIAKMNNDWGRLIFTDNAGKSITIFTTDEITDLALYDLPPSPPRGIFDARYESNKIVENISTKKSIRINSDKYPITIKAEGLNITVRDNIDGEQLNETIKNGKEITITNNKITSISVTGESSGELPVSFELYQNYPNPFNPTTTIKFSIQKESNVNLSIYNVLGELILTLVNEQKKAGYYEYKMDASNLASGVYLYRVKAGDFVETKKMVLMK